MTTSEQDRTAFEAARDKRNAVRAAEASGQVADSMDARRNLMAQVRSGEITLAQAQSELKKIQAWAKKAGKVTRSQAFSMG